ncbi:DinB family protein [Flammeovirga sp. OC4]|uniref:DinB family protein n=1 Tax=Flammeovirga sp. OC4 TaxID=1382345 RepID=UPI0005C553EA|nr:DinB family protein [Flammeovirga sp. OC4]
MRKKDLPFMPNFFDRYINKVDDKLSVIDALSETIVKIDADFVADLKALKMNVYAPNKWTTHELMQHMIDTERILAYRALTIAREDKTNLPGFEEDDYVISSMANHRELDDMINEFQILRVNTISLFKSFTDDMLQHAGSANGNEISTLALGFTIAGHQLHHMDIIKERYFPLLESK